MKNWRTFILGLVVCANTAFAAPQEVDRVAAVVNDGVILESDVTKLLQSVKINAKESGQQMPDDRTLRQQVIERLIMDSIQLQMANKMGLNIPDDELDHAIANIAAQNRMSVEQLRTRLNYEGINYSDYRNQIRREMLISQVRNNEVRHRVSVLPQEVDTLAQQLAQQNDSDTELNLSHILLALPENPTQQQVDKAEALATQIIDDLHNGANFAKLAMSYSADAQALKGGQMGWGKIQELPSLFAERVINAHKGDIIGPIRSGVGFHILKVNDLRGANRAIAITEVHARHILLPPSVVLTNEQARAKLQDIAEKIKSGQASFAAEAKQSSQDPGSALQGGDLGWSSPDRYDPAFRDALLKLKKGEISPPIRSSFGWHLIQLIDTRKVDRTEEIQKERAYRLLFNRKFAEEAQTWLQEQRAAAYVKITNDNSNVS